MLYSCHYLFFNVYIFLYLFCSNEYIVTIIVVVLMDDNLQLNGVMGLVIGVKGILYFVTKSEVNLTSLDWINFFLSLETAREN